LNDLLHSVIANMAHNLARSGLGHNLALLGLSLHMFYQKIRLAIVFGVHNIAESDLDMPPALEENFYLVANSLIIHNTPCWVVIG